MASDRVHFVAVKTLPSAPLCPFQQRTRKLASRLVPLWGEHSAALNRMSLPGEPAGKRAKGGLEQGCSIPPVRQADE